MDGGNIIQYFSPWRTAFHADVAFGSLWKVLPLRAGPKISHWWSGRSAPSTSKKSRPKQKVGMKPDSIEPCVFEINDRSKR